MKITASRQGTSGAITIDGEDFAGFYIDAEEMLSVVATQVLADHDIRVTIWTVEGDSLVAEV